MEAVPRLPMICCDLKVSPSNTEFGPVLKRYIRDQYHEDPDLYTKEIKELEALRQNAIKAPMDFTGCSILKKYYAQLQKLQSRFPMTDDGAACVPFMWTDIYSGVAYNITDIEYEEACILYNIGALHSRLGTLDNRMNAEGIKIACTHFQCAAFAFQHLRDTYPQPKGSDMSHDLLTFFINVMLGQAQECILEKSMLDNRKSSITAKIAAQVVEYYKCALAVMVSGSPSSDAGSILDIVGSKVHKGWQRMIQFKMTYYTAIAHLYMGNQSEENEKWGERVAWYQSAFDNLSEAFKIAKKLDRSELNEALSFTNDVIAGKHSSSKKENDFVYHDKVPALSSLPDLKGASLVKGIPFSASDPEVSGPDIFARLVPMEAHETSSLYSEEKAKILRSVTSKIEGKNEELVAYLSSLQLETTSFDDEERIPQELIEKCAAISVRPTMISDLKNVMNELMEVSNDVEISLKTSTALLAEEEQKETKHQETFGKRGPSMIIVDLKKECSKYEEAHKKAVASNNTLQAAINIHIENLTKLSAPLDQIAESLPSALCLKNPESVKAMDEFSHLVNKVEEMKKQRHFLESQLREALIKDDITKRLVTLDKKDDLQQTFAQELKKHDETLIYLDQNLTAQDNILCALTAANAQYAETRQALKEIKLKREEMVKMLISSYDSYDETMETVKKGLEFYKKLQSNAAKLLTRIKSVTKVQDEERAQRAEAEMRKRGKVHNLHGVPQESTAPKLRDYLPYMNKRGMPTAVPGAAPSALMYPNFSPNVAPTQVLPEHEHVRQATLGGPASIQPISDPKFKPSPQDMTRPSESSNTPSMGMRTAPLGSEQASNPANSNAAVSSSAAGYPYAQQSWNYTSPTVPPSQQPYANQTHQPVKNTTQMPYPSSQSVSSGSHPQSYAPSASVSNSQVAQNYAYQHSQQPASLPNISPYSTQRATQLPGQPSYQQPTSFSGSHIPQSTSASGTASYMQNAGPTGYTPTPYSGYSQVPASSVYPPASAGVPRSYPIATMYNNAAATSVNYSTTTAMNHSTMPQPRQNIPTPPVGSTEYAPTPHSGYSQVPASSVYPPASATMPRSYPVSTMYNNAAATSVNYSTTTAANCSTIQQPGQTVPTSPVMSNTGAYGVQNYSAYPASQAYSMSSNYPMAPASYSNTTASGSNQYIQGYGGPVQSPQTDVAKSVDSRSNASISHPSVNSVTANAYSQQNMYSHMTNNSSGKTSNIPQSLSQVPVSGLPMRTQTNLSNHPISSQTGFPSNATAGSFAPGVQVAFPSSTVQGQATGQPGYSTSAGQNQATFQSAATAQSFSKGPIPAQAPGNVQAQTAGSTQTQSGISNSFQSDMAVSGYLPQHSSNLNPMYNEATAQLSKLPHPVYSTQYRPTGNEVISYTYVGGVSISGPVENYVVMQNTVALPTSSHSQNSNVQPQQKLNQTVQNVPDSISAAYGSNTSIPNQQLQPPMEPKSLTPSQSTQSSPLHTDGEASKNAATPDLASRCSSVDSQGDGQRDFITPPPDPNDAAEKEVSSTLPVLQPKVIDIQTLAAMKDKEATPPVKDPLDDPAVRAKFISEVEKYEKLVDSLLKKSLNGTTPLDQKWKEFNDVQDKESRKNSISVARCCPLKNRFPDVMPYDCNRVKLTTAKDDYINASYLKDICPNAPVFVITQAPIPATFNDFWLMVWEQQVETLICLLSDSELKTPLYFPKNRGQTLTFGSYEVSLQSHKAKNGFAERMINLTHVKNRTSRVVVHLQYSEWPVSNVPSSPATLLQFIADVLSYYKQQRNLMRPVVVHCSAGIGRSGCFCLITALVSEMNNGHGPRDITQVASSVSHQRKFLIQDKDQLMFCYNAVLYYAQDILMKRGILTTRASFENKLPSSNPTSTHVRHPSEDFILGGGLAKLQSGIAKLGLSSDGPEQKASEAEPETSQFVGNGNTEVPEAVSETKSVEIPLPDPKDAVKVAKESPGKPKDSLNKPSITSLLDPLNFTLDSTGSPAKRKITKENFATSKGSLSTTTLDSGDPLSQLDPLWTLKK